MERIKVTYEVVTPLFLGGAKKESAELRLPSVKGALRAWYRVVVPDFNQYVSGTTITKEEHLFGSAKSGAGQSRFLLRMVGESPKSKREWKDFYQLQYLSFFLRKRAYLYPEQHFSLEMILRPSAKAKNEEEKAKLKEEKAQHLRALVSCLWLLGHVGGLGSRKNRGFGVLALQEWETNGEAQEYMAALPNAHQATTMEEWVDQFKQGLDKIDQWFPGSRLKEWATLLYHTQSDGFDWKNALIEGANCIMEFRKSKKNRSDRMALGMPFLLPGAEYKPKGYDRMGSPVMLSVVKLSSGCYPVFLLRSGTDEAFPSVVKVEKGTRKERDYFISISDVIKRFREHLQEQQFKEARWGE